MYFIEYEVEYFDGIQCAGPFNSHEIDSHKADISGYEGVRNVRIVFKEERNPEE